jgi:actin-related protein 5
MKQLANLASDQPGKKRRRGGDDDNFGANDEDWGVYRQVAMGEQSEDEEEEDLDAEMKNVEAQLLRYDPGFSESKTMAAQKDWTKSLMHAFLRGPRPFDSESQQETHQLHLNVERIRVPEVVFQPAIAGLDQAGIVDIAADMINHGMGFPQELNNILKDIFITGGNTLFAGFEERLSKELRAVLPTDSLMRVRRAVDPLLDAWRGAAQWSKESSFKSALVTREEYQEKGSDYFKEHALGNMSTF